MVAVRGKLNNGVDGVIVVSPDHPFLDTTQAPPVFVAAPIEEQIIAGSFVVEVYQSEAIGGDGRGGEAVTYLWELFRTDTQVKYYFFNGQEYEGGVNYDQSTGEWYTGSVRTEDSVRVDRVETNLRDLIISIHAICPNSAEIVEFADLVGINRQAPYMGISLIRLADLLTNDPVYRQRISSQLSFTGNYNGSTTYQPLDVVDYEGSSYVYVGLSPGTVPPPPTDVWQLLAKKGDPGTGTSAEIVGYNPTAWTRSDQAAARGDVVDAIASIGDVDLSQYLKKTDSNAILTNTTFRGSMQRAPLNPPVQDNDVPTVKFVRDAIIQSVSFLPRPMLSARRGTPYTLTKEISSTIQWNLERTYTPDQGNVNDFIDTSGNITIPQDGLYLLFVSLSFRIVGNFSTNSTRSIIQGRVFSGSSEIARLFHADESSYAGTWYMQKQGFQLLNFSQGDNLTIRAFASSSAITNVVVAYENTNRANNFFMIWRLV